MSGLSVSMPFFQRLIYVLEQPNNGQTSSQALTLANQICALANLSPTLSTEIIAFQNTFQGTIQNPTGGLFSMQGTAGVFNSDTDGPIIVLPGLSIFTNATTQQLSQVTFSQSLVPISSTTVTTAGQIVGALSHELGHFEDPNIPIASSLNKSEGVNQGFYVGLKLLSEGKATANAVEVAREIASSPGATAVDQVAIPLGNNISSALNLLTENPNPNSVIAVGSYADFFATQNPSTGGIDPDTGSAITYTQSFLNDWTAAPGPGAADVMLIPSTITFVYVTENPDGSLQSITFIRNPAVAGATVYPASSVYIFSTSTRTDFGPGKNPVVLDTEHASADGTSQLTNFANAGIGGYTLAVNASVNSLTNGSATDVTASIAGGFSAAVPMAVTNFGTISGGIYGLVLAGGSSVTNGSATDTTASISGGAIGILMGAGTNSVANFGKVSGGVEMNGAGQATITNGSASDTVASITAGGIYAASGTVAKVANFGSVAGGMSLTGGSSVTNGSATDITALISAEVAISSSAPGTVVNYGTISGGTISSAGVSLSGTGSVTNGSAADTKALISGNDGIVMANANVTNYGTITGTNVAVTGSGTITNAGIISNTAGIIGSAITFQPGTNRLVEDPGSAIIGQVNGSAYTLELAGGSTSGSIGGLGTTITKFGAVTVDTGASWTLAGSNNVPTIVDNGFINVAGSLDVSSAVDPSSSGVFLLTGQSNLEIAAILGGGNLKIQFIGSNSSNRLTIDSAAQFGQNIGSSSYIGPVIQGFIAGDTIDLKGIASAGLSPPAYNQSSGDLQITGSGKALATLAFQNSTLGAGSFHVASDGSGGTLITHS